VHKFRQGEKFYSIIELVDWLDKGYSVYMRGKYMHFSWLISMQLRYLQVLVDEGVVCRAIRNNK